MQNRAARSLGRDRRGVCFSEPTCTMVGALPLAPSMGAMKR